LSQGFCGSCGCDLIAAVKKKLESLESKVVEAISAAKRLDFEKSNALLKLVTRETDFRFKEVVGKAKIAQRKIESIASRESELASDRIVAAQQAYQGGDLVRVVELLSDLSPTLMTPEASEILKRSQSLVQQLEQTQHSLQQAFAKRDWATSGVLLDRLLELQPDDESVAKLASKVGQKLISKAERLGVEHKYSGASELLHCVPSNAQDQAFEKIRAKIDRVQWLGNQFEGEPFATPTLGRLAKQWVDQSHGDPDAIGMLNRIAKRIKQPRMSPRDRYPRLDVTIRSWVGGAIGFLAFPNCVECNDHVELRNAPGQFNAAIGLALQGLGLGRVSDDFSPKRSALKRLTRKKSAQCWGIDVGSSGLKAVLLETVDNDRPRLVQCIHQPHDTPLTRSVTQTKTDEIIRLAIQQFLSEHDVTSTPVWVSFPARELVSRTVKLPPVGDKQAKLLMEKEVQARIPLPLAEVTSVQWIASMPPEGLTVIGRPAIVSAAKKQVVDSYLENLSRAGLQISGLQATPIALTNFASEEFAEELAGDSQCDSGSTLKIPTIALLDCGSETTTLLLISDRSFWFWSFESGGEEFTRLISRATKTVRGEAEKLKRDPASLPCPETQFETAQRRMEEMHGRLRKLVTDTAGEHQELDIRQTWCCGGGTLTHGWMKRILCDE
jgi:Tfp pilus assembly PilM family ATPase